MEREKNWQEKTGENLRNGGLIAAAIGLVLNFELVVYSLLAAGSGEYIRRKSQKKNKQAMPQAA